MQSISEVALDAPIRDFLTLGVPIVKTNDPIRAVLDKYNASNAHALLVVDEAGVLAGLVTDKDLTKLVDLDEKSTASALLNASELVAVRDSAKLWQLLKIMNGENPSGQRFDVVPVVDESTRPVGVIKRGALTVELAEKLSRGDFVPSGLVS